MGLGVERVDFYAGEFPGSRSVGDGLQQRWRFGQGHSMNDCAAVLDQAYGLLGRGQLSFVLRKIGIHNAHPYQRFLPEPS